MASRSSHTVNPSYGTSSTTLHAVETPGAARAPAPPCSPVGLASGLAPALAAPPTCICACGLAHTANPLSNEGLVQFVASCEYATQNTSPHLPAHTHHRTMGQSADTLRRRIKTRAASLRRRAAQPALRACGAPAPCTWSCDVRLCVRMHS